MPMHAVTIRRWQLGLAFLILALSYVAGLFWIQEGRLQSCERTYQGVADVFAPFKPAHLTDGQKRDWEKFERRIAFLKGNCGNQIRLWHP